MGCRSKIACNAPYFEDPRSGYFSETIRKATCQEYGCCWANDDKSRGYQCYKDRADILDGAGLGCLIDKPPSCATFEEYNRTTSDMISMCGDSCCQRKQTLQIASLVDGSSATRYRENQTRAVDTKTQFARRIIPRFLRKI